MITPENSYWLLIGSIVGVILLVLVLIWGFWPEVKRIPFKKTKKLQGNKTNSYRPTPKPLLNRNELMKSIAEAQIAVVEYLELMDSSENWRKQHPHTVNVDAMGAVSDTQERYKVALKSLEIQIISAGRYYHPKLKPLFLFIQSGGALSKNAKTILNFKFRLDKVIEQAIEDIDNLNQQASRKEGSQSQ